MADQKRDVDQLIEDGLIRYGGGDLAGALAAWERALIQEPGNLQAVGYIDYVRQVFDQLNRPTRDELVVPFGLGHGDAPDYQIEISPEPPDDDAVQPGGGLQDGWPITSDDERATVERMYTMADPPGTLDLELDEPRHGAEIETLSGKLLEETGDFADITPVHGIDVAAAMRSAEPRRGQSESDGTFDGPEQEITGSLPDFSDSDAPEPTPGFEAASGHSTDLKRPELGFVKPRYANTVSRKSGITGAPPMSGPMSGSAQGPMPGATTGDEAVTNRMQAVRPAPPSLFGDRALPVEPLGPGSRDDRDERRDSRPGMPRSESRPSKPALVVPAERQSRPALAASVKSSSGSGSGAQSSGGGSFDPVITAEFDSAALAAAEREPTRPRQAVSALLGASLGNATPTPRPMPAVRPEVRPEEPSPAPVRQSAPSHPPVTPGLLDPWSALEEANGGGEYSNLELAPVIEELPSSSEADAAEAAAAAGRSRPGLPGVSGAGGNPGGVVSAAIGDTSGAAPGREAMTRNLGLAGRYQPRDDLKFGEESPTRELARPPTEGDEEKTKAWASIPGMPLPVVPADALEALTAQIVPKLERDVPPDESRDDRLRRRITSLVELAGEWSRMGDPRRAVAAVDLALGEDPDSALAQKLIHRNREAIMNIFQGYLGSLERRPTLARSLNALGAAPIGARAAFLLSRVDGHLTYDEILDVSGMPRLEAYRYLCQLLIRGILTAE